MDNKKLDILKSCLTHFNSEVQRKKYIEILDNLKQRNKTLSIGLLGEFSSGKSTLINALLGKDILPRTQESTTGAITRISYSPTESIIIKLKNKDEILKTLFKYRDNISNIMKRDYKARQCIDNRYITIDHELLKIINLNFEDFKNLKKKNLKQSDFLNKYKDHIFMNFFYLDNIKVFFHESIEYDSSDENTNFILSSELELLNKKHNLIINNFNKSEISLKNSEDLQNYSEKTFPCEIIEEIIIKTPLLNLGNEKIELIDLPGLSVANENHIKITHNIANTVSAFIIIEGEKVIEGDTKKIINKLKEEFPKIFDLCYLIKNKYDLLLADKDHFEEKEADFETTRVSLNIPVENTFKLSAYKVLKSSPSIEDDNYIKNFEKFKESLLKNFNNLENNFEQVIIKTLTPIKNSLLEEIKNSINEKERFINSENIFASTEARMKFKEYYSLCRNNINSLIDTSYKSIVKWDIEKNLNIIDELFNDINNKTDSYYEDLSLIGKDINFTIPRTICDTYFREFKLNEKIRKEYSNFIESSFYYEFNKYLQSNFLNSAFKKYMNIEMSKKLDAYASNTKLLDRLSAIIDITLINYLFDIENIKLKFIYFIKTIFDENSEENTDDKLPSLDKILSTYEISDNLSRKDIYEKILKKEIETFLNENCMENINKFTEVIIKNYLEEIREFLNNCINDDSYEINFEIQYKEQEKNNINYKFEKIKDHILRLKETQQKLENLF